MHKVLLDSVVAIQSLELTRVTQEGPSFVILDKSLKPLSVPNVKFKEYLIL